LDLEKLGVSMGHRKRLLQAIATLGGRTHAIDGAGRDGSHTPAAHAEGR
jgi:hypothetical protein